MGRLTDKHYTGDGYYLICSGVLRCPDDCDECDKLDEAIDRLGAYEDTGLEPEDFALGLNAAARKKAGAEYYGLTPDQLDKAVDLFQAEKDGRLVVLPCKVGDTVYQLTNKRHAKGVGIAPRIVSSACVWSNGEYALAHQGMTYCQSKELGKTWFLTRDEAEAALKTQSGVELSEKTQPDADKKEEI